MARRIHTADQIIHTLRAVEVLLAHGQSVQHASSSDWHYGADLLSLEFIKRPEETSRLMNSVC